MMQCLSICVKQGCVTVHIIPNIAEVLTKVPTHPRLLISSHECHLTQKGNTLGKKKKEKKHLSCDSALRFRQKTIFTFLNSALWCFDNMENCEPSQRQLLTYVRFNTITVTQVKSRACAHSTAGQESVAFLENINPAPTSFETSGSMRGGGALTSPLAFSGSFKVSPPPRGQQQQEEAPLTVQKRVINSGAVAR